MKFDVLVIIYKKILMSYQYIKTVQFSMSWYGSDSDDAEYERYCCDET